MHTPETQSALILIEFQREWLDPDIGSLGDLMKDLSQFSTSQEQARKVLESARSSDIHVVHVPNRFGEGYPEIGGGRPAGLFHAIPEAGTWTGVGQEFASDFEPQEGEFVVEGRVGASAFAHSNLSAFLRNNQIETIYLAGYALHVCVESTLRHGHDLGYDVRIIEDATSAFTADQKRHVLDHVVHHFGRTVTAKEFQSWLHRPV
jgi:nicotinamidase-related amidase